MKIYLTILASSFLFIHCRGPRAMTAKELPLKKDCFLDNHERKVAGEIHNQIALITKTNDVILLTIGTDRYLTCNLPDTFRGNKIQVTGKVLRPLPTEKLMAIPLKITKAVSMD